MSRNLDLSLNFHAPDWGRVAVLANDEFDLVEFDKEIAEVLDGNWRREIVGFSVNEEFIRIVKCPAYLVTNERDAVAVRMILGEGYYHSVVYG